jgi:Bacterial EndoU nuclease
MDRTVDARSRWRGDAAGAYRTTFSDHRSGVGELARLCEGSANLLLEWSRQLANFQAEAVALQSRVGQASEDLCSAVASSRTDDMDSDPAVRRHRTHLARLNRACEGLRERYLAAGAVLALRLAGLDMPGQEARSAAGSPGGITTMMTIAPSDGGNQWENVNGPHPDPAQISGDNARAHIIWGERDGRAGGGHYYESYQPDKTVFPKSWTPDDIMRNLEDVAKNPDMTPVWQPKYKTFLMTGTRHGVTMNVTVDPEGNIVTGFPTAGRGVCVTDENGDPHRIPGRDSDDWGDAELRAQGETEDQAATNAANDVAAAQIAAITQQEQQEAKMLALIEAETMGDE